MVTFLSIQQLQCQAAHFNGSWEKKNRNACFKYHFHLPNKLGSFV